MVGKKFMRSHFSFFLTGRFLCIFPLANFGTDHKGQWKSRESLTKPCQFSEVLLCSGNAIEAQSLRVWELSLCLYSVNTISCSDPDTSLNIYIPLEIAKSKVVLGNCVSLICLIQYFTQLVAKVRFIFWFKKNIIVVLYAYCFCLLPQNISALKVNQKKKSNSKCETSLFAPCTGSGSQPSHTDSVVLNYLRSGCESLS